MPLVHGERDEEFDARAQEIERLRAQLRGPRAPAARLGPALTVVLILVVSVLLAVAGGGLAALRPTPHAARPHTSRPTTGESDVEEHIALTVTTVTGSVRGDVRVGASCVLDVVPVDGGATRLASVRCGVFDLFPPSSCSRDGARLVCTEGRDAPSLEWDGPTRSAYVSERGWTVQLRAD